MAGTLLKALRRTSPDRAFTPAELYVYTDNERAVQTYRRNGWEPQPKVRRHPFAGRHEQRLRAATHRMTDRLPPTRGQGQR